MDIGLHVRVELIDGIDVRGEGDFVVLPETEGRPVHGTELHEELVPLADIRKIQIVGQPLGTPEVDFRIAVEDLVGGHGHDRRLVAEILPDGPGESLVAVTFLRRVRKAAHDPVQGVLKGLAVERIQWDRLRNRRGSGRMVVLVLHLHGVGLPDLPGDAGTGIDVGREIARIHRSRQNLGRFPVRNRDLGPFRDVLDHVLPADGLPADAPGLRQQDHRMAAAVYPSFQHQLGLQRRFDPGAGCHDEKRKERKEVLFHGQNL